MQSFRVPLLLSFVFLTMWMALTAPRLSEAHPHNAL